MSGVDILLTMMPFVLFAGVLGAFGYGRWLDLFFRTKIKRIIFKKDVVILGIRNKDKRSIRFVDIFPEFGIVKVGEYFWIYDGKKAYRAVADNNPNTITVVTKKMIKKDYVVKEDDKKRIFKFLQRNKSTTQIPEDALILQQEKMFNVREQFIKWQEGVPVIYVDEKDLLPIEFSDVKDNDKIEPVEISPVLGGYIDNEKLKDKKKRGDGPDLAKIATLILVLLALAVSYLAFTSAEGAKLAAEEIRNQIVSSPLFKASSASSSGGGSGAVIVVPAGGQISPDGNIVVGG